MHANSIWGRISKQQNATRRARRHRSKSPPLPLQAMLGAPCLRSWKSSSQGDSLHRHVQDKLNRQACTASVHESARWRHQQKHAFPFALVSFSGRDRVASACACSTQSAWPRTEKALRALQQVFNRTLAPLRAHLPTDFAVVVSVCGALRSSLALATRWRLTSLLVARAAA